jgi:hypothetical protein
MLKLKLYAVVSCLLVTSVFILSSFKSNNDKIKTVNHVKMRFIPNVAENVVLPIGFADTLKKAEELFNLIINSEDFKVALEKRSFADSAFTKSKRNCFERIYDQSGRVSGLGVYQNLTRHKNVEIEWVIKKYKNGEKTSVMGFASYCVNRITSHDYWIKNGQYLSYRFVRHLAHEYTHVVGYRHDKALPKEHKFAKGDDPAMGVGGIVGDIMIDWTKRGVI